MKDIKLTGLYPIFGKMVRDFHYLEVRLTAISSIFHLGE